MPGQIDLHLHLDGSISVKSARELARNQRITLPETDEELSKMLMCPQNCRNLNEYLAMFLLPGSLMQTREAIMLSAFNLCEELREKGLEYAEIRFAPQKHCAKGLSQRQVVEAAIMGIQNSSFDSKLILCAMRDSKDNKKANLETVQLAKNYLKDGVCACDLAGAEGLFPNYQYKYVFDRAKSLGVPFTIHAGEALGAESVKLAIEYGASRIGHGVRSVEDPSVVELLVKNNIPLEVCPTSNINTCVYENVRDIPIPQLLDAGVLVTINSDNMSVSATDVNQEMELVQETFDFDDTQMSVLQDNARKAIFS